MVRSSAFKEEHLTCVEAGPTGGCGWVTTVHVIFLGEKKPVSFNVFIFQKKQKQTTARHFSSRKLLCNATNMILPAAPSLLALVSLQLCKFLLRVQRLTTVSPRIHIKQHAITAHVKAFGFSLVCFCCLFRSCQTQTAEPCAVGG